MFGMDDDHKGVVFGWQTALLCPLPTFWWDKRGNVWFKLCFIFIKLEEED